MNLSEKISLILIDNGFNVIPSYKTERLINEACEYLEISDEVLIAQQHGIAKNVFILIDGEAEFIKYYNNQLYKLANLKGKSIPLGVSGLNPPSRYMADIYLKANSKYIKIDINKLKEIGNIDPCYLSYIYSFFVSQSMNLI